MTLIAVVYIIVHNMLLMGPPGSGKSMLAHRFAGLLPAMTTEEALQSAAVASLGGRFSLDKWAQRPTCSPHHTASAVAVTFRNHCDIVEMNATT